MSSEAIPEPVEARPWRADDGPMPRVTTWPERGCPALGVWSHEAWRYARVMGRQDWADGRVFYQVSVDLRGDTTVSVRLYQWPQPGLRVERRPPGRERSAGTAADRGQGKMPRARPRTSSAGPNGRPPTAS
ncbi:hypothetical protein KUF83_30305 [Streptomyces sp. BV286]|uniref:hypothetical protein n=1 Tax=Streptomyces sp. BV286 TaxID=2849672 RepID=UPI001C2E09FB|nr:hypothetical protein [Streptomyces sp. BV286]MBV1940829.1 hypothetical protein [Streptomyces sp. BV286]